MENDPVLGVLGLSLRAGKLAYGDEQVRVLCEDKKARCVFVAGDAGSGIQKKAAQYAGKAGIPCVTLTQSKNVLGRALGKTDCAVCALSDIGLAASVMRRLAAANDVYAKDAEQLEEKNKRIQSRKGKKKHKEIQAVKNSPSVNMRIKPSSRNGRGWHKSGV